MIKKKKKTEKDMKCHGLIAAEQMVQKTEKPYCSEYGMINPAKLKISAETICKLKQASA